MKKILITLKTIILSLIITYALSEILNIYHFKTLPTISTITYLLIIFSFITYLQISLDYIIDKKIYSKMIRK